MDSIILPANSQFFKLPYELRLPIYCAVFEGSQVIFEPYEDKAGHGFLKKEKKPWKVAIEASILLTCRACYFEGREIFVKSARFCASWYDTEWMIESMSEFSKMNVTHIGDSCHCYPKKHSWKVVVAQLPQLEKCDMRDIFSQVRPRKDLTSFAEGWFVDKMMLAAIGYDVDTFLRREELRSDDKIVFRVKIYFPPLFRQSHGVDSSQKTCFINLNKKIAFTTETSPSIPDEEGFRQAYC